MIYETSTMRLRPLTVSDTHQQEYLMWMQDPQVTKYNSHGLFPMSEDELNEFRAELNQSRSSIVWAIEAKVQSTDEKLSYHHIGNVALQRIDWINRSAELAIVIGEVPYWGHGFGSAACSFCVYHAFSILNLNRVWTGTAEFNAGMRGIAQKLGMTEEGVFRQAVFLGGRYVDVYEYGLLRSNWPGMDAR